MKNSIISLRFFAILILGVLCLPKLSAQDVHFSQFTQAPLLLNPAQIGNFRGDFRFNALYRNQWPSVPVEFETVTGSVDFNFCNSCSGYSPYSLGAVFVNDVAGLSRLGLTQLSLGGAIRRPIFVKHEISFGVLLGIGQRRFDTGDLQSNARFQNGFQGLFDEVGFDDRYTFLDLAAGINTRWNGKTDRSFLDIGIGAYHINRYNTSFFASNTQRQAIRYNFYAAGNHKLGQHFDLLAQALYTYVKEQDAFLVGLGGRLYLNNGNNFWKRFGLQVMGSYRFDDAFIPSAGLLYRAWSFGVSYDYNTSDFQAATNNNGGWEFTLGYVFRPINVPFRRICPISL